MDLSWDPPANASDAGDVTTYHIRFKQDGREWCNEMTVDGSTTSVALTRESGLVPQTTYEFAVRAQSGDDIGEWETVSAYLGAYMYCNNRHATIRLPVARNIYILCSRGV